MTTKITARLEWLANEIWILECSAVTSGQRSLLKSYKKEREELTATMNIQSN